MPNFEYHVEEARRLKNQIYQLRLGIGGVFRFKFIIIGDHEVGKTSIVRRYVDDKFSTDYRATIGLNVTTHSFEFLGNEVSITLWDIGAQSFFKRFRQTYYTGAQAAFIVFDLTNRTSFENVKTWYNELTDFIGNRDIPLVIIGNKTDLVDERDINQQEGVALASELSQWGISKISYIETSALTGENINDAFTLISYFYISKSKEHEEEILKKELMKNIESILEQKGTLSLTLINENVFWNPALQILSELKGFGECAIKSENDQETIYCYDNDLILKDYLLDNFEISETDGVLCIFDARNKNHINPEWRAIIIKIIEEIQEGKVVLIGIRVSENVEWSRLLEEFDINEKLEKKFVSLLFFKVGLEYRLEIYDQLEIMINTIKEFQK